MSGDNIWLKRFSTLHTDGAIEAVAKTIARPLMEEFDGLPYGSKVEWEKLPEREKIPIRFIAQRAVRAMVSYAHVAASGTEARQRQDPEEGLDPKGDGPARSEAKGGAHE